MTEQQAYTDGPNTHKYPDANFVTDWTPASLDDVDGVRHHFHVPTRIADLFRAEATAAAEQRLRAGIEALRASDCPDCRGDGWTAGTTADPDEDGQPGEPYQYQRACAHPSLFLTVLDSAPAPASPRQGEPVDGLDVAWRAVEDALPDGWRIDGLNNSEDGWFAIAVSATAEEFTDTPGYHGTPAEALRALAAALSEPAEAGEP